jgi:hypothetical protein
VDHFALLCAVFRLGSFEGSAAEYRLKPIGVFAVRQAAIGVPEGRMYAPHIVDLTLSFTGVPAAKRATRSFARTLP